MTAVTITVKETCSAYATNTIQGKRASSTHSAEMAACKLGAKLLGVEFEGVQQIIRTDLPASVSCWELLQATNAQNPVQKRSDCGFVGVDMALPQSTKKTAQNA